MEHGAHLAARPSDARPTRFDVPRLPQRPGRPGGRAWHRSGPLALTLIVLASVTTIAVAFSGPSVMTLVVGPRHNLLPPWYLPTQYFFIDDFVATLALWLAVAVGAIGLAIALRALADGWRPRVRRWMIIGVVLNLATALVPPVTSADVLMYAAYGRLQVLGRDPYSITPAEVYRSQFDPVLRWTERPWQDTPSVYGPLASFAQVLANWLGGPWMHDVVFWLQLGCVVPLLIIGLGVVHLTRDDPAVQSRAMIMTVLNPLMIWAVVAGAHNEALGVVFGVAALFSMRRSSFLAGVLVGLAGCVKVSNVFFGLAMLWAYRRHPKRLAGMIVGALLPLVACYVLWQPQALFAAWRNTGLVSTGSWADIFVLWLGPDYGLDNVKHALAIVGVIMLVLVSIMLLRLLPWREVPGRRSEADPHHDPMTVAFRTAAALASAWLLTSPYSLSWYDLMAWAPLAVLGASFLDMVMLWRGVWLSLAFVTGRDVQFSPEVKFTGQLLQRICGAMSILLIFVVLVWFIADLRARPVKPAHRLRALVARRR